MKGFRCPTESIVSLYAPLLRSLHRGNQSQVTWYAPSEERVSPEFPVIFAGKNMFRSLVKVTHSPINKGGWSMIYLCVVGDWVMSGWCPLQMAIYSSWMKCGDGFEDNLGNPGVSHWLRD